MIKDQLAESWKSLDHFNKSHCGRLCSEASTDYQKAAVLAAAAEGRSVDEISEESEDDSFEDFIIPELPCGEKVSITLLKTWGDPYYVGLNGIEIFSEDGCLMEIVQISLFPPCDNSDLAVCAKLENLIDGKYRTKDDTRLWLTSFHSKNAPQITLRLKENKKIAMIRIWNYNKSRIHATRGVRWLEIAADDNPIFKGEISMASGNTETEADHLGDTILFTTSDEVLNKISENDFFIDKDWENSRNQNSVPSSSATNGSGRPATGEHAKHLVRQDASDCIPPQLWHTFSVQGTNVIVEITTLTIEICSNWGCPDFQGLTGIQILDREANQIQVEAYQVRSTHPTNVFRLFNGKNLTTNPGDMWLASRDDETPISLEIEFPSVTESIGMSIWNYNASLEMSCAGVRHMNVFIDGDCVMRNVQLRKAPGSLQYDFVQDMFYGQKQLDSPREPHGLCGFVYQIQLLSTWGDEFYVGLNGVELLGADGRSKNITLKNLAAYPESVNVIPNVSDDPRSSDKLINGVFDTANPENMWLTPVMRNEINRIYLVFDEPTEVQGIRIWNYRKTPARGARDILILVDDLIVFSGCVNASTTDRTGCLDVRFGSC